jgi:CRP-like cAMP-binding protein
MKHATTTLYQLFESFGVFTSAEIEQTLQYFEYKIYTKETIIVDIGQVNDKMYFIENGMLREFSYQDKEQHEEQDEEQTITHWLMSENNFVYLVESFLDQKPSTTALEVIEKAKLWVISKQNIDKLYIEFPQMNLVGRLMVEQKLKKYEIYIGMLRQSPEARLDWFYHFHPEFANRVPLKYIATYLNITPSTLSRVRKRLFSKK